MRIHLINLDRSPGRLAEFTARNGHLRNISRFSAVDGARADRNELVNRGIIEPTLDYTAGALGNALSHLALWELVISTNEPLTLCEDDAILNKTFEIDAAILTSTLRNDWHIIFWGWNFDAFAIFELIPGVSPFLARFDQEQMRQGVDRFQSATLSPRPFRLLAAFGIVCYTISPLGARALKQLCIPLRRAWVSVPYVDQLFENRDLSISLLEILPRINAYASFPPLVITNNDHATSTVLPSKLVD